MSEIESKKVKQFLSGLSPEIPIDAIELIIARKAVIIAEQEAEERHEQQLQKLKDMVVEAYKSNCRNYTACYFDEKPCTADCEYLGDFIQKLTEKQ